MLIVWGKKPICQGSKEMRSNRAQFSKEYLEKDTLNNENTAKVKLKINKLNKKNRCIVRN